VCPCSPVRWQWVVSVSSETLRSRRPGQRPEKWRLQQRPALVLLTRADAGSQTERPGVRRELQFRVKALHYRR
jgi:hypothetical protein